mmetsp:Transcript_14209/g.51090  ORF Transcript_14209/g.51090 Transcript_14209/m.51090 type:complete len:217 (+) Transcript_14209:433-1083(+)
MSALTRNDRRSVRSTSPSAASAPPHSARAVRFTASATMVPPAPAVESEPTSSLSNSAIMRTPVSFSRSPSPPPACNSAFNAQNDDARLSNLPEYMNSLAAPPMTDGCVSHTSSSKSTISSGSQFSSSARTARSSGWCAGFFFFFFFFFNFASSSPSAAASFATAVSCSSSPRIAVASTGANCVSVLGLNPSVFTFRSRWIASVGMRMIGRSTRTSS